MMKCADFQSIVAGEREDDLSAAEALAFEQHLDSCPACVAAVARAEEDLDRLAGALEPPALPASAWASVDAAVSAAVRGPAAATPATAQVPASAPAPRGQLVLMPQPLPVLVTTAVASAAPLASAAQAAPVPAQPVIRRFWARSTNARSSGFGLAAAVAVGAFGLAFFSLSSPRPRPTVGIGRVAPPEDKDVEIVKFETGAGYQPMSGGSANKFIFIFPRGN